MIRINGNYVEHNQPVPFDIALPSQWSELSPHQVATILEVLTYKRADKYVIAASLLSLLFDKHYHILTKQSDEYMHSLLPLTNFLMETQPPATNFFPKLKINKKVCLAPADDLSNIGFGEFCFAYQAYCYYTIWKDKRYIDKLIAILYRPANPEMTTESLNYSGDLRQIFNENLVAGRERGIADIELKFKRACLEWFTAAIYNVMSVRPHVFPQTPEGQETETDPPDDHRTWFTVFRELLGPKWGTEEKLKYTNAMFVLDALEEQHIELEHRK